MLVCYQILGGTAGNEGTGAPTASAAVPVDPEQEGFSLLAPEPSVLHCGSQCNLKSFHRSSPCVTLRLYLELAGHATQPFA